MTLVEMSVEEEEKFILDLVRAIDFCATVQGRQFEPCEPAFPPFVWPSVYNYFFEMTRGDVLHDGSVWKFIDIE